MRWMTEDARMVCAHETGRVTGFDPRQRWVTIGGRCVLVESDPAGRTISGCPVVPPTGKPCTSTLPVVKGYSALVRIDQRRVCLDTVRGLTNGVAPVDYHVRSAGQSLLESTA